MDRVNCICISAGGKPGLTQHYFVVVYDRQGFLFLEKALCSDKINDFSQSFQCFDEKSDPAIFILLLLPRITVIAILFDQTCEFVSVLSSDKSFCLGTLIWKWCFFLWVWFGHVLSFNSDGISSGGAWIKCQYFRTGLRVEELFDRSPFVSPPSVPTFCSCEQSSRCRAADVCAKQPSGALPSYSRVITLPLFLVLRDSWHVPLRMNICPSRR